MASPNFKNFAAATLLQLDVAKLKYFSTNIYFYIIIANYVFAKNKLVEISRVLVLSFLAALPLKAAFVKNKI